jgi:hypothetical protein
VICVRRLNSGASEFIREGESHRSGINMFVGARFDANEKATRQLGGLLFKGE